MASALLQELQAFVLHDVKVTDRRLGNGSYGSVVEVEIPGAVCAAKTIHEHLVQGHRYARERFVGECKLMSTLRHPNIVQFLGLCPVPGSSFPSLVMERLRCSLDDVLEANPYPKQEIPLGMKRSILHDVARGLSFLHCRSKPIVHRDLSARNVLLNSAMEAKIADFGVARIVDVRHTMTSGPGAISYMPPEAMESGKYDTPIDVFSFGHLALFTLIQKFPGDLKAPNYDVDGVLRPRTEVERREEYFKLLYSQLAKDHPLVCITEKCLANSPKRRPRIEEVSETLMATKTVVSDRFEQSTKLELIRMIEEKEEEIKGKERNIPQKQPAAQVQPDPGVRMTWTRASVMPFGIERASAVVLDGKVYVAGDADTEFHEHIVVVYDPERDIWTGLVECPAKEFGLVAFQSELVIVGGCIPQEVSSSGPLIPSVASRKLFVWKQHIREWHKSYPEMPEARRLLSAAGYKNFLIVVGGKSPNTSEPKCLIFNSITQQWLQASSPPFQVVRGCTSIFSDDLYVFMSSGNQAFSVSIPDLIDEANQSKGTSPVTWKRLPLTYNSARGTTFQNRVIVAGGSAKPGGKGLNSIHYYDTVLNKWESFSKLNMEFKLPVPLSRFALASISDQQILIAGGYENTTMEYRRQAYIGRVTGL